MTAIKTPRRRRDWPRYKAHVKRMIAKAALRSTDTSLEPQPVPRGASLRQPQRYSRRGGTLPAKGTPHMRYPLIGDVGGLQPPVFTASALPKHRRGRK